VEKGSTARSPDFESVPSLLRASGMRPGHAERIMDESA
jgi:hypothetical protein